MRRRTRREQSRRRGTLNEVTTTAARRTARGGRVMSVIDFFEYLASSDDTGRARARARRRLGRAPDRRRRTSPPRSGAERSAVAADGNHAGAPRLVRRRSSSAWRSVRPTSSRPLSSRYCVKSSSSNVDVEVDGRRRDPLVLDVDDDLETRVFFDRLPEPVDRRFGNRGDDEAHLPGVVAEDVGEAGRQHGLEAVVHERPHRVLARRTGAEVRARDEDVRAVVARPG